VFLVNVPVSIVAITLIWRWVPESRDPDGRRVQPFAVLMSVVGLVLVVFGIIKGGERGIWSSPQVIGPLVAGLVLLTAFVLRERKAAEPVLDVSLFRNPIFAAGSSATGLMMFALFGATFYLTFYLQFVHELSPLRAGLAIIPSALAQMYFSPRTAGLVNRFGTRTVCAVGLLTVSVAFLGIHFVHADTPIWYLEGLLFLQGAGMSHVFAPCTAVVMAAVSRVRAGAGSAVNNTVRHVGGALGVAMIGSLISSVYRANVTPALGALPAAARERAGESLGATRAAVAVAAASGRHVDGVLPAAREAFMHAMHWASFTSACVAVLSAVVILLFMPARPLVVDDSVDEMLAEVTV
jgi:predicted MFS family arabinose efflux permease